ncbi:MAG: NfeD family protein [Acidobacteriota bacterium]
MLRSAWSTAEWNAAGWIAVAAVLSLLGMALTVSADTQSADTPSADRQSPTETRPADTPPAETPSPADTPPSADSKATKPVVVVAQIDSPIHPVVARHLARALERAQELGAEALVVELDTPGGSLQSTRDIVTSFLGAPVPVVVYVAPNGAQAASAGFFLLLGADVAAMAPETNTGAAHPVAGGGQEIEGTLGDKVEQDTMAFIRALAERHERDLALAEEAVRDSRSFTAREAADAGLVDLVAEGRQALLEALDGRTVEKDGASHVLRTADARLVEHEMPVFQRVLAAIAHPEIAGLLMALGMLGLYVEISNPGLVLPGTLGGIFVILALFSLSVLPVNAAGLALVGLALILFVAELHMPTFGALTTGGVVALALGLMILFEDADPSMRLHPLWIAGLLLMVVPAVGYTTYTTVRLRKVRPTTGMDGMLGELGEVRTALGPGIVGGKVFVHGELWSADADAPLIPGTAVRVEAVDGLRLRVVPAPPETES